MGWAERLRSEGTEPDPRFTLANERTFLAWIRTALALVAGGIGLVLLGSAVSGSAFTRWARAERAMRLGEPLPVPRLAPLIAVGVAVMALVTVVLLVVARA